MAITWEISDFPVPGITRSEELATFSLAVETGKGRIAGDTALGVAGTTSGEAHAVRLEDANSPHFYSMAASGRAIPRITVTTTDEAGTTPARVVELEDCRVEGVNSMGNIGPERYQAVVLTFGRGMSSVTSP